MTADPLSAERLQSASSAIMARCAELRTISAGIEGYERLYFTSEHRAAADLLIDWLGEAGLNARLDAVGNVIGRWDPEGARGPALVLGSHFDTVRDAGTYDGQLGVVTAIEAVSALRASGAALPFPVEVHAYADEEGTRFHTMLLGSGFVTGLETAEVLDRSDAEGISIAEAMRRFGLDPDNIAAAQRSSGDFRGYLEVHIEQGPVLEAESLAVGAVTGIAGQTRGTISVSGSAGHAGTVPMTMRRDALTAASEAVLAIEAVACAGWKSGLVATVGEMRVVPGASNVIPGEVHLTVDLRSAEDQARAMALTEIEDRLAAIAGNRDLTVVVGVASDTPATPCDSALLAAIDEACTAVQGRAKHLVSGAGHDAIALARLCPVGMIFVRCKGGISHNPAESITRADAAAGFETLLRTILHIAEQA